MPAQIENFASVAELESLIRAGDISTAIKIIQNLNRNKIQRKDLFQYANIANRVGLSSIAYRFLNSLIRSSKNGSATENEKIEYAEALRGMGLIQEAINLLKEIDPVLFPVANLRISFCLMTQWRYEEAIPYLNEFISTQPVEQDSQRYSRTIAKVNLAAALVAIRRDQEALSLLNSLRIETKQAGHHLLYGNCLELLIQLFVLQGEHGLADQIFSELDATVFNARTRYSLYLQKWKAISKSLRQQAVDPELSECLERAIQDEDWETVRDCNLYVALLTKNDCLLEHVYYGTPFESYREKMRALSPGRFKVSDSYIWNQFPQAEGREIFDVLKGEFESGRASLECGQLMHRMMMLLCKDFYRPLTTGRAFSELFSEEHFTQTGSTNRICQIVKRLREWFHQIGDLFEIEEIKSSYRLIVKPGVCIRVPAAMPDLSQQAVTLYQFKSRLGREEFVRSEVIHHMNCSTASANRLLKWSTETGRCEAIGNGRQRKYRFAG